MKVNQLAVPGLYSYKARLSYDIRNGGHLEASLCGKVLALLNDLPDGQTLCHGDYHPGNVLITEEGPMVIDWVTASAGSRWADVARTSMILRVGAKAAGKLVHPLVRMAIQIYRRVYERHYRLLVPDTGNELLRWMPVVVAARLNENIPLEGDALRKMIREI